MKKITTLSLLLILFLHSFAQKNETAESAPLGELEDGWVDLLQFKNGNTAFLFFTDEDDLTIRLYNASHKLIADKKIKPAFVKQTMYNFIKSNFIISDQIVILFSAAKKVSFAKVSPVLYRIILNGTTGMVVKEEEIATLTPFGAAGEVEFRKQRDGAPDFHVSKDPDSDNYAIAQFDSYESDVNKKLKITHYGSDNKIINEGYFVNNTYPDISYSDMAVDGNTKLYVCASVSANDKGGFTSIGCFNKETSKFTQKTLDKVHVKSRVYYNKQNSSLILFGVNYTGSESNIRFMRPSKFTDHYATSITVFDPITLIIDFEKILTGPTLTKDYGNTNTPSGPFSGTPYGFYINSDKTYTILYQELNMQIVYNGSHKSAINAFFGSVGVSTLNDKFQELNSYLIPASYYLQHEEFGTMSSYNNNASRPKYVKYNNPYKLCSYVNTKSQKIVLLNDDPRNIEEVKTGKIKLVGGIDGLDGYKLTIDEAKINRELIFPKVGKFYSLGMFIAHKYDSATETFVTIMRSNKKGWQNQIVWMKL